MPMRLKRNLGFFRSIGHLKREFARDLLYCVFKSFITLLSHSCPEGLRHVLIRTWFVLLSGSSLAFAYEHLSVRSLYFPFSEPCLPRPGHFPWRGSDISLNVCISLSCHQAFQLSRFFPGVIHLSLGLTSWWHSLM